MRHLTVSFIIAFLAIVLPASAQEELWIPAAASNPGLHGTMWTTQLWLGSRVVDVPTEVRAAFFPEQEGTNDPVEVTLEIQPSSQIEILDAVATLFGENRPGAIRLRSDHPFIAQSRTANDGRGAGSFGQGIPAVRPADSTEWLNFIGVSNLPGDDGHRSNIGIVNIGDEEGNVLIAARDGETLESLGAVFVDIGPNGWFQADLFSLFNLGQQEVKLAEVSALGSGTILIGYVSRVDNRSGDGTFTAPSNEEFVRIESRIWELEATLTYTGDTTIDRVEYTTGDGLVTFDSPESGFNTGILEFDSPTTFCIRALGESGPQPGSIEFEVNRRPENDPIWAQGRHRMGWSAGSGSNPLDEEYCVDLN